ncbi:MAG: alkylhydroperoxidase [Rhodospirillales bacterium]|jgi:AhpD family alkylhydroperoxidase|nr:alkylhydroperoxidase [Rhodospirillales bacterium]
MTQRMNWLGETNDGLDGMRRTEAFLAKSLDPMLLALVKMRASQINGCAYCLHMHSAEARKHGEREERLLLLDAWRESALYSERERAALAWTEALTRITDGHAPDEIYQAARREFSDADLVALSLAIAMINAWNRLAIGFRAAHPADVPQAA